MGDLSGKAAIVGIGATDFSKNSGRSELRLAAEAVLDAFDDAGLTPADVDGLTTFTMDTNTEVAVARATGIGDLKFFSKIHLRRGRRVRDRAARGDGRRHRNGGLSSWRTGRSTSGPVCGSVRCRLRLVEKRAASRLRPGPTIRSPIRTDCPRPQRRWP